MSLKLNLKNLIEDCGYTITELNHQINKRNGTDNSVQNLSAKINRGTLKYTEVEEILDILGYVIKWEKLFEPHIPDVEVSEFSMETTPDENEILEKIVPNYSESEFTNAYKTVVTEEVTKYVISKSEQMIKKAISELFAGSGGISYENISKFNNEPGEED